MPTTAKRLYRRRNKRWVQWRRVCRNYRRLIKDCKEQEVLHGTKWKDGMVRHYTGLLDELIKREPEQYVD